MNGPSVVSTLAALGLRTCTGVPAIPINTPSFRNFAVVSVGCVSNAHGGAVVALLVSISNRYEFWHGCSLQAQLDRASSKPCILIVNEANVKILAEHG